MRPDTTQMTPVNALDDEKLRALADEAQSFITGFRWCRSVREGFLADGVGDIVGIFLFRIEPAVIGVDDTLWVVVGDLPSAYLVCDDALDWPSALRAYVREMRRWVAAVRAGSSLDNIIPVRAEPTREHADMLASRLDCIEEHMIHESTINNNRDT
jgi:hypothetical protein